MDRDRIYQAEDKHWYFNVRGNLAKGPYLTYQEAEEALAVHVRRCNRRLVGPPLAGLFRGFTAPRRRENAPKHS